MPKHDFKQHVDYISGYIILQNTAENDTFPFLRNKISGSPISPFSVYPNGSLQPGHVSQQSFQSVMNNGQTISSPNSTHSTHSNTQNAMHSMGNYSPMSDKSQSPIPILNFKSHGIPMINHYKKIHFLPTRRGAQLKLFHNMNFFRTDKHFQLAVQFAREVDIRYITFQWEYCTEDGWEKFTSEIKSPINSGSISNIPNFKDGTMSSVSNSPLGTPNTPKYTPSKNSKNNDGARNGSQGQKPFVLIHKLNVDKSWLRMEVQFPIGSIALKGKNVQWKSLNGGKMFRVVMKTYLAVEGTSSYEVQSVVIPYVIDNKRSKENDKIDRIHVHFRDVIENNEYKVILDEENSSNPNKLEFEFQAHRIQFKELEFLKLISPPHLALANHVLTEVSIRSSGDTSPMSSISSPGASSYSSAPAMEVSKFEQDSLPNSYNGISRSFPGSGIPTFNQIGNNNFNNNIPINFTANSNNFKQNFNHNPTITNTQVNTNQNQDNFFETQTRIFNQPHMQQEMNHLLEMQNQFNDIKNQLPIPFQFSNMHDTESIIEEANLEIGGDMDLNFIDEFDHHHFNKVNNSALNLQNVPQLSDVQEMPNKKRKRSNSNEFFNQLQFDLEMEGDHIEKAVLDFAPLNTHSSISLFGQFRDCSLSLDSLFVYFGNQKGTILNITSTCISVLTPKVSKAITVAITIENNSNIIPKRIPFRFVEDYNAEVSRLALNTNSSSTFGHNYQKNDSSYFDDRNLILDTSFIHTSNQWTNSVNALGQNLLHIFSEKGLPDYVFTCLRIGIPPTKRDNLLRTPLHIAAARGHIMTAKLILKCAGLNLLTWYDAFDETPLDLALRLKKYDFIEFLFKWIHANFLPSKVHEIKDRFAYIFKVCAFVKYMKPYYIPTSITKSLNLSIDNQISSQISNHEVTYFAKIAEQETLINQQDQTIEELTKRVKYLSIENKKFTEIPTTSIKSQKTKSIKQQYADEAQLMDVLTRLKYSTLQNQNKQNIERLIKQNSDVNELKQKLVLSQMKIKQHELELALVMNEYKEALEQIRIQKTKSRKHIFLNVVSHNESDDLFVKSMVSVTDRIKKVNENAWKEYLANQEEKCVENNIAQEIHFSVSERPILNKLMTSHRRNGFKEDVKSLRRLIPQYESADLIKETLFGDSNSNDKIFNACLILTPFSDVKKEKQLFTDTQPEANILFIHTAILLNNCIIEWQEDSLVNLRKIQENQISYYILPGIQSLKVPQSIQDAIVQQIVTWNRTKEFDIYQRNHQHFVDTIMSIICSLPLGSIDWIPKSNEMSLMSRYIQDIREDSTRSIPHTYLRDDDNDIEDFIEFHSQEELNLYMSEYCNAMEENEVNLLQSFDSIFHLIYNSQQPTEEHSEYSESTRLSLEKVQGIKNEQNKQDSKHLQFQNHAKTSTPTISFQKVNQQSRMRLQLLEDF